MDKFEKSGKHLEKVKLWLNPSIKPNSAEQSLAAITYVDVELASERLQRFAPLLEHLFPELKDSKGIIDSGLLALNIPLDIPTDCGKLWLKADHTLPVAGSVKARGGIHEVLEFVEMVAIKHGLLSDDKSILSLVEPTAKDIFKKYSVTVGSTGNLGVSIGVIGAALGFKATVHMSSEAKEWKKAHLRERGVNVIEHQGDYALAVAAGRQDALDDEYVHFVDDERSTSLFAGYAVAAERLMAQLQSLDIKVDEENPLFVYLPCGVGGAPGGICYGLKEFLGENVHCFFVEPQESSCFQLQMVHPEQANISIYDVGQNNKTEADGLAVPVASQMAVEMMRTRLSGVATTNDDYLFADLYLLKEYANQRVEPSAAAAVSGPRALFNTKEGKEYLEKNHLTNKMNNANHILWATGGLFLPPDEYHEFWSRGKRAAKTLFG